LLEEDAVIIREDKDSLSRLLGLEPDRIPATVIAEYELRLKMFHSDGHSGPLGTIGIIDMLRSMKLGPPRRKPDETLVDWSRMPRDGSVRLDCRSPSGEWLSGAYVGQVGLGKLAVRLDGKAWIDEFAMKDVRLERDRPPEPYVATEPEEELEEEESPPEPSLATAVPSLESHAEQLATTEPGTVVWIDEDGDGNWREAEFAGYEGGLVKVRIQGVMRSVPAPLVARMTPVESEV
jgi:hypothetical protein